MKKDSRIYVAGHRGLVGSAIVRWLEREGHTNLIQRSRAEVDLLEQRAVQEFFRREEPEYVFVAAGRVGGIYANDTQQTEFLYENLMIAANVIQAAAASAVEKLLFIGSSCVYPRNAGQPIQESSLLSGPLEPTNEGYAIAKIAGLKLCEFYNRQHGRRFISAMPTNLYGPGDNFDPMNSHVIPGMMRRFHEAKVARAPEVVVWGTGTPRREFLFVDDLAEALVLLMQRYEDPATINVGVGEDCTIAELAEAIRETTGFEGRILFDPSKPDGMPRKLLDVTKIRSLGWIARHKLRDGLARTWQWVMSSGVLDAAVTWTAGRDPAHV